MGHTFDEGREIMAGETLFSSFQAGARLLRQALAGSVARIPVYAQMHDFAAHEAGLSGWDFYGQPDRLVPEILAAQARYGLDVASVTFDVYNIEAEGLGQTLLLSQEGVPDIDRRHPLIREEADLKQIRTPDFATAGRFPMVLSLHQLFRELTGLEPTPTFCAPFSLAANLRGIEQFLVDIHVNPRFARKLLDKITEEVLAPWISYQQAQFPGARRASGADATASPPIVNIPILREWVLPPILRLRELCAPGVYVANWAGERYLKDPGQLLDLRLEANPFWIQGQDPDVEALGPERYKTYARQHDLPLILGVGAGFLAQASPEEVTERVRRYVEIGAQGGRFALYLCNIGANTPPANIRAAVAAAHHPGDKGQGTVG